MGIPRLTYREFQKLCTVYRSLSDEERGFKQSLVERLAKDNPSLAAKMAELTGEQMFLLHQHLQKRPARRKNRRST